MSYIGTAPTIGNFQVCDAISVVNGQASYTMQVSGVNATPQSANHMLVSLNGILQAPNSSFTVSGSVITFASNLVTGDVIDFIQILGDVLDLGVPSDATVTNAKTNFVSTSSNAGLQIKGDGTTDGTLQLNCSQNSHGIKLKSPPHSASASYTLTFPNNDGNANQVLTTDGSGVLSFADASGGIISSNYAVSASSTSTTSTSFISTYSPGISVTPASTSSKFLVIATGSMFNNNGSYASGLTLFRDSTNLSATTSDDGDMVLINDNHHNFSLVDLDEPNTTSQVTYIMKYRATNSNTYARINANNTQSQLVVIEF